MIRFLKYTWLYATISAVVIGAGLYSMVRYGFTYSIDFVGGTNVEYQLNKALNPQEVRAFLAKENVAVATLTVSKNDLFFRSKPIDEKLEAKLRTDMEKQLGVKIKTLRFETVGPLIGQETMRKTFVAAILAIGGILLYMTFAFKGFDFALAAILAMIHDFLVVIGTYSLFSHFLGAELDTMFVTAVLTSMSFSVHDTIVIFDKIREYFRTEGRGNMEYYANRALTETMVRSVNNSMTIIFMLLALTLLGGSTIRFFVATMLVGTVTGTYSSPFVATPLLVWLEKRRARK